MLSLSELPINKLPTNGYPYVVAHLGSEESIYGVTFSFVPTASNTVGSVTCRVFSLGDRAEIIGTSERLILEYAGGTVYNVNTGATGDRQAGTLSFNFSSGRDNVFILRPGVAPYASAPFLPRMVAFVFENASLKLQGVYMMRRTRMVEA